MVFLWLLSAGIMREKLENSEVLYIHAETIGYFPRVHIYERGKSGQKSFLGRTLFAPKKHLFSELFNNHFFCIGY